MLTGIRMRRVLVFLFLLFGTAAALSGNRLFGFVLDRRQLESAVIFTGMIWGIILFEDHRPWFALGAAMAVLACGLLSLDQLAEAAGLEVIFFLFGTFLVAGYLEESGFFEHLATRIVGGVGPRPFLLMAVLLFAAMTASAIIGEVAA